MYPTHHRSDLGFSVTNYKVQGATCNKLVPDLNDIFPKVTFNSLLVMISRVKTKEDLRLMPLHPGGNLNHLRNLKPDPHLLDWEAGFGPDHGVAREWKVELAREAYEKRPQPSGKKRPSMNNLPRAKKSRTAIPPDSSS